MASRLDFLAMARTMTWALSRLFDALDTGVLEFTGGTPARIPPRTPRDPQHVSCRLTFSMMTELDDESDAEWESFPACIS